MALLPRTKRRDHVATWACLVGEIILQVAVDAAVDVAAVASVGENVVVDAWLVAGA